jgi:hypothetical protein
MKKSGWIYLAILTVVMMGMCAYMVKAISDVYVEDTDDYDFSYEENVTDKYIQYQIIQSDFSISDTYEGYITYDDSFVNYEQDNARKDVEIYVNKGDCVQVNDVLCGNTTKTTVSTVEGIVTDVSKGDTVEITIADKNKTMIVVSVPEERQSYIKKVKKIKAKISANKETELNIAWIDPYIEDGYFHVYIENQNELFANTKINVTFDFKTLKDVVTIPQEYIKKDSEGNSYITIYDEEAEKTSNYDVTIGDTSNHICKLNDAEELVGKIAVVDKKEQLINGE